MGPGEAGEIAESIGAVDDRVGGGHFGIAKHKVAVWRGKEMIFLIWYFWLPKMFYF